MNNTYRFPRRVVIENTNACNAHCVMCPREKLGRKIGFMDLDAFTQLVDECAQQGATKLSLHNFGEPLLDKQLCDKIQYAKKRGFRETFIVTTASLLTPRLAERLIRAGLDRIKISFYGVNREEYEQVHLGLSYAVSRDHVRGLLRLKKELGSKTPKVTLRYIGRLRSFLTFAWQWLPRCRVLFGLLHNYSSGRRYRPIKKQGRFRYCRYALRPTMYMLWNGDVAPCCYDFNGEIVLGNVFKDGVEGVWNGKAYEVFREAHRRKEFDKYPLCDNCDKLNHWFS